MKVKFCKIITNSQKYVFLLEFIISDFGVKNRRWTQKGQG